MEASLVDVLVRSKLYYHCLAQRVVGRIWTVALTVLMKVPMKVPMKA